MASFEYEIVHTAPSAADHLHLRTVAGLTPPPPLAIEAALAASVHTIIAVAHPRQTAERDSPTAISAAAAIPSGQTEPLTVGMVRLVGDGHLMCQIVDMAVDPAHQGRGLGKRLLGAMLAWIDEHAPDAYVSLIADAPGQRLYKSLGFEPTQGIGMKRSQWGR